MEYARGHGYAVPRVERASGTDIVMERVEGPSMLADMARPPWTMAAHAATLARLHEQLHEILAPSWLERRLGTGDALLHLDPHPDNVLLTAAGPVVIDWPHAAAGPGAADVAHTWLVTATATPPGAGMPPAVRWQQSVGASSCADSSPASTAPRSSPSSRRWPSAGSTIATSARPSASARRGSSSACWRSRRAIWEQ